MVAIMIPVAAAMMLLFALMALYTVRRLKRLRPDKQNRPSLGSILWPWASIKVCFSGVFCWCCNCCSPAHQQGGLVSSSKGWRRGEKKTRPTIGGDETSRAITTHNPSITSKQMVKILKRGTARKWGIEFSHLTFKDRIGKGSQGEVFAGTWNGTDVAIKRINTKEVRSVVVEEFCQEFDIMQRLRHPNLTFLLGVSMNTQWFCLVTELVSRGSLFALLKDRDAKGEALTWRRCLRVALDCARGMSYLHGNTPPILHRDLKSLNILVSSTWRGKTNRRIDDKHCPGGGSMTKTHRSPATQLNRTTHSSACPPPPSSLDNNNNSNLLLLKNASSSRVKSKTAFLQAMALATKPKRCDGRTPMIIHKDTDVLFAQAVAHYAQAIAAFDSLHKHFVEAKRKERHWKQMARTKRKKKRKNQTTETQKKKNVKQETINRKRKKKTRSSKVSANMAATSPRRALDDILPQDHDKDEKKDNYNIQKNGDEEEAGKHRRERAQARTLMMQRMQASRKQHPKTGHMDLTENGVSPAPSLSSTSSSPSPASSTEHDEQAKTLSRYDKIPSQNSMNELIETEKTYVSKLNDLIVIYEKNKAQCNDKKMDAFLRYAQPIHRIHSEFLVTLSSTPNAMGVGSAVQTLVDKLQEPPVYLHYLQSYSQHQVCLGRGGRTSCLEVAKSQSSLFIVVAQRLPRIRLLLEDHINSLDTNDSCRDAIETAHKKVSSLLSDMNASLKASPEVPKRRTSKLKRFSSIASMVRSSLSSSSTSSGPLNDVRLDVSLGEPSPNASLPSPSLCIASFV